MNYNQAARLVAAEKRRLDELLRVYIARLDASECDRSKLAAAVGLKPRMAKGKRPGG